MRKVILLAAVMLQAACIFGENTVTVVNGSEDRLTGVTVTVCDTVLVVPELAPGEEAVFSPHYACDGSFLVETPEISGSFGYVTQGITDDRVMITIREDSIDFLQKIE